MALAVAEGTDGFSRALGSLAPRLLLVLGDRTEPFAAALAAAYGGIPVAHIHGGDVTGSAIDDLHRDLISRIARLHLPATERSRRRLLSLGVEGEIEVVGAPGLDEVLEVGPVRREEVLGELGAPAGPVLAVLLHPVPQQAGRAGDEAEEVLAAAEVWAERRGGTVVALYPNNDAGHRAVIERIERRRAHPGFRIFPTLPRRGYLRLLAASECLLGNSSSALIESVSLGLPAVNVGERQAGRERNGNVLDAVPERRAVLAALERVRTDPAVRSAVASRANIFGDGRAAERIVLAVERFLGGPGASAGGRRTRESEVS
jgi:GDP/UDP-N,N'-diacetylbacillosamine 2-epimerase (hydrolysing)